jgi:hypothetical protein
VSDGLGRVGVRAQAPADLWRPSVPVQPNGGQHRPTPLSPDCAPRHQASQLLDHQGRQGETVWFWSVKAIKVRWTHDLISYDSPLQSSRGSLRKSTLQLFCRHLESRSHPSWVVLRLSSLPWPRWITPTVSHLRSHGDPSFGLSSMPTATLPVLPTDSSLLSSRLSSYQWPSPTRPHQ